MKIQKILKSDFSCQISFKIDNQGNMINIKVNSQIPDKQVEENMILALKQIDIKWSPEKFRGIPIISRYTMPVNISKD